MPNFTGDSAPALQAQLNADPQYRALQAKFLRSQAPLDWSALSEYANRVLDAGGNRSRFALQINGQGEVEIQDRDNPWTSPATWGPIAVGAAGGVAALPGLFGAGGGGAGAGAGIGATGAGAAGVGAGAAGVNAAALAALAGGGGAATAAGLGGGGATTGAGASIPSWLKTLAPVAAGITSRVAGGGGGTGGSSIDPALMSRLSQMLDMAQQRVQSAQPVQEAAMRMATRMAPTYQDSPRLTQATQAATTPAPSGAAFSPQVLAAFQRLAGGR